MSCIYFVRHGATANDQGDGAGDSITGWTSLPLDESGRAEAGETAARLADKPIGHVLSSDLARAQETANVIARACGVAYVQATKDWRPWNLGKFRGQKQGDVEARIAVYQRSPWTQIPDGESFMSFFHRFTTAYKDLYENQLHRTGDAVVVTHSLNCHLLEAWQRAHQTDNPCLLQGRVFRSTSTEPGAILRVECEPGRIGRAIKMGGEELSSSVPPSTRAGAMPSLVR